MQTSSVIGSGWTNDTATIREDDESQEHLQVSSPVHKAVAAHSDTTVNPTGAQEITHEMSTEL